MSKRRLHMRLEYIVISTHILWALLSLKASLKVIYNQSKGLWATFRSVFSTSQPLADINMLTDKVLFIDNNYLFDDYYIYHRKLSEL